MKCVRNINETESWSCPPLPQLLYTVSEQCRLIQARERRPLSRHDGSSPGRTIGWQQKQSTTHGHRISPAEIAPRFECTRARSSEIERDEISLDPQGAACPASPPLTGPPSLALLHAPSLALLQWTGFSGPASVALLQLTGFNEPPSVDRLQWTCFSGPPLCSRGRSSSAQTCGTPKQGA